MKSHPQTKTNPQKKNRKAWWLLVCSLSFLIFSLHLGCVHIKLPHFPNRIKLNTLGWDHPVQIEFYQEDQQVVPDVVAASTQSLRLLNSWGNFQAPFRIMIFPTHRSLEEAVFRKYKWLRAWARYDEVYLQSPQTWRRRYYQYPLLELLAHELTHVLMYQLCCTQKNWHRKRIPFWFREGMASHIARQGYRRAKLDLRKFLRTKEGKHLIFRPEPYLKKYPNYAYSIAHWKFTSLMRKKGKQGVQELLSIIQSGYSYQTAFLKTYKMTDLQFRKRFLKKFLSPKKSFPKKWERKRKKQQNISRVFRHPAGHQHCSFTKKQLESKVKDW